MTLKRLAFSAVLSLLISYCIYSNNSGQFHEPVPSNIRQASQQQPLKPTIPQPIAELPIKYTPQGCEQYRSLVSKYPWNVDVALAVMNAESSCEYNQSYLNTNGSIDRGLMQINSVHADMVNGNLDSLFDPATNIAIAYRIYSGAGWSAWTTCQTKVRCY